ncbi:MAG: tetratricopeptide repeat protein [Gammaproteobacteria bacterium]|nr:tetratricopeptide repeat protein [Gammaproteobacteria bacterium]
MSIEHDKDGKPRQVAALAGSFQTKSDDRETEARSLNSPRPGGGHPHRSGEETYRSGDLIGQLYRVHRILGSGGFGVVYLVSAEDTGAVYALKMLHAALLSDAHARERFRREAELWLRLDRHPHLVQAQFVQEVDEQLLIGMEYVAGDEEGLGCLEDFLLRRPPDFVMALRWAIHIARGLEYACSKGIVSHRDLKPANILIGPNKIAKVSDFGLAVAVSRRVPETAVCEPRYTSRADAVVTHALASVAGTPYYMAPEQFVDADACGQTCDIYALGVIMYRMVANGRLPFAEKPPRADDRQAWARFWRNMARLHATARIPKVSSALFPLIARCLDKDPRRRFQSFGELREDLEGLLAMLFGERVPSFNTDTLAAWEWNNKGASFHQLKKYIDAVACFDKALTLEPDMLAAWNNKGNALGDMGKHAEALACYEHVLSKESGNAKAWHNKGGVLCALGRFEEALQCYDAALTIAPRFAAAWNSKGTALCSMGRCHTAVACYRAALKHDRRYVKAYYNLGTAFDGMGRHDEALSAYDAALEIDPLYHKAWNNRGETLQHMKRLTEASDSFTYAVAAQHGYALGWFNLAQARLALGQIKEGRVALKEFLSQADQRADFAERVAQAKKQLEDIDGQV